MSKTYIFIAFALLVGSAIGFQTAKFGPVNPDPNGVRPIEAADTLFIKGLSKPTTTSTTTSRSPPSC